MCRAYLELRRCLDSYQGALPDFREAIHRAEELLNAGKLPCLSGEDAVWLRVFFAGCLSRLAVLRWTGRVLHGDPHAGNVVRTRQGLRWLDFESACTGPVEWDFSALPGGAHSCAHDPALLATLTQLRSACVVVWCASKQHPDAAETEAISHHLGAIRG